MYYKYFKQHLKRSHFAVSVIIFLFQIKVETVFVTLLKLILLEYTDFIVGKR